MTRAYCVPPRRGSAGRPAQIRIFVGLKAHQADGQMLGVGLTGRHCAPALPVLVAKYGQTHIWDAAGRPVCEVVATDGIAQLVNRFDALMAAQLGGRFAVAAVQVATRVVVHHDCFRLLATYARCASKAIATQLSDHNPRSSAHRIQDTIMLPSSRDRSSASPRSYSPVSFTSRATRHKSPWTTPIATAISGRLIGSWPQISRE